MKFTTLPIDIIHKHLLEIMKFIDEFCLQNNLKYSVAYGTAIGAVRHKGFIPWDDDFDIIMPRHDYESFITNFKETSLFKIKTPKDRKYYYPFVKVLDKRLTGKENGRKGETAIWVDIFAADLIFNSKKFFNKNKKDRSRIIKIGWDHPPIVYKQGFFRKIVFNLYSFVCFVCTRFISFSYAYKKLMSHISNNHGKTYAVCVWGSYSILGDEDVFDHLLRIKFEDSEFYILSNFEFYLNFLYGDYMKLPPIDERKPSHSFLCYNLEKL